MVALLMAAIAVGTLLGAPLSAHAEEVVSSGTLVDDPTSWDGRDVRFEGEAIGESLLRGGEAWIHLNDDAYARGSVEAGAELAGFNSGMPVLVSAEDAARISHFGDHATRGDLVRVTGTFRAASAERGGEMLIEAASLEIVEPGGPVDDPVEPWKPPLIVGLALACLVAWAALRRRRPQY